MESYTTIVPKKPTCQCCKYEVSESDSFCNNCGFPLNGTDEEKGKFIGQYLTQKNTKAEIENQVKSARTTLFVVAGLMVLSGLFSLATDKEGDGGFILIASLVIAAIFCGLAFWSNKNPFGALLTGLIMYISLILLSIIEDPIELVRGVIVKVIIISYMIKGVIGASKVRGMKN